MSVFSSTLIFQGELPTLTSHTTGFQDCTGFDTVSAEISSIPGIYAAGSFQLIVNWSIDGVTVDYSVTYNAVNRSPTLWNLSYSDQVRAEFVQFSLYNNDAGANSRYYRAQGFFMQ